MSDATKKDSVSESSTDLNFVEQEKKVETFWSEEIRSLKRASELRGTKGIPYNADSGN